MTVALSYLPVQAFRDNNGLPLVGGKLFSYQGGTSTPAPTYTDSTGATPLPNPIVLNARGEVATSTGVSSGLWVPPNTAYKFLLQDALGNTIWTIDQVFAPLSNINTVLTALGTNVIPSPTNTYTLGNATSSWANLYVGDEAAPIFDPISGNVGFYDETAAELAASVTPTNFSYPPIDIRRYGALFNASTDDTSALNTAISVAQQTINGAVGNVVQLPLGTSILSSEVTLPDDVRFLGTNKNGSIFQASGSWNSGSSPYMFHAVNGTTSMFDSLLESLTIDCNNISGLGCILSDAWQENCGPRRCLLYRFTTYGIHYQNGYGGAAFSKIEDTEMFASSSASTAGVRVEQLSSVGAFMLLMKNVSITALTGGSALPRGVDIVNDSCNAIGVHFENTTSGFYLDGVGSHTLINCTGNSTVTNLVEIASTFRGTLKMIGCLRTGATNFIKDNRVGGYGTITGVDIPDLAIATGTGHVVSNISQAASAVVTVTDTSGSNPFSINTLLTFSTVAGMTQINGLQGKVSAIGGSSGAWTATVNINSSGFGAYVSGGIATTPAERGVTAANTAVAGCAFDGTLTGTNAPTYGFNVKSVTRNSAGNYSVNFTNPLLTSGSQIISVISPGTSDVIQNLGPASGFAQFVVSALSVAAGALVVTPTDRSPITFLCFGQGT